jgi:hypothetical protein
MSSLDIFDASMTDDEIFSLMEDRLSMTEIRDIGDGRLRLNDESDLDLRLWNIAIDIENGA